MKKAFKQLVFIALSFAIFVGTLGLESVFAGPIAAQEKGHLHVVVAAGQTVNVTHGTTVQTLTGSGDQNLMADDKVEETSGSGAEIHFSDKGVLRLDQNTLVSVDYLDQQKDAYVLNLQKGQVWGNTLYSSGLFNLTANGAYLIPNSAAFNVKIGDDKTSVYANRHQVVVGLVPLNYKARSAKVFPDSDLINSYLLAEGNQTTVFADKITANADTLSKLFYSKLVKEFPFGLIDPQQLSADPWLKQNVALDKTYESTVAQNDSQMIRSRGLKIADLNNTFGGALNSFYNVLTFSESKVIDRNMGDIFDRFDDAKYLLVFGQTTKAQDYLGSFKGLLDTAFTAQDDMFKAAAMNRLQDEYNQLSYVRGDNPLAPAQAAVNTYLMSKLGDSETEIQQKFLLVRNVINQVYDLVQINAQAARDKLLAYSDSLQKLVAAESTRLSRMSNILAEENQIMDNLLLNNSNFYRANIFAAKSQLEQEWLALLPEGEGKNEEKQTIIGTKIQMLNQLKTFFLADKVTIDDAKAISKNILHDYDILELAANQQVAIDALYDKQTQDFDVFYRYLTSPEYVATTLHGSSRQQQFTAFLQAEQDLQTQNFTIEQLKEDILGTQTTPTVTPAKILAQAQQDFDSVGATNVVFGTYDDVTQKLIPVQSMTIAGVTIQAQYDWNNQLVSQITEGDTLLSADAVKLVNLSLLIQTKTQTQIEPTPQPSPVPTPSPTPSPSSQSKSELVGKILLIQKLKANDIAVAQADITIVDLTNSLFTVQKATLVSDQSLTITFDVDAKNSVVTNLALKNSTGNTPISGSINLGDVSAQVKAAK